MFFRTFLTSVLFLLSACSSKEASEQYRADYNFSNIKTYTTYVRSSEFTEQQNIRDSLRNSIELAIERVFDKEGYRYLESDDADIIIAYRLTGAGYRNVIRKALSRDDCYNCPLTQITAEKKEQVTPSTDIRAGREGRPQKSLDVKAPLTRKEKRQLSSKDGDDNLLFIDFVNSQNQRSIWQGSYPLDIKDRDNSNEVQVKINDALNAIMASYQETN